MSILSWVKDTFSTKMKGNSHVVAYGNSILELFYKELAIRSVSSMIANAIVMSEIKTIEKGKEIKKNNYYLFNIEPNKNQNATEFWQQVIDTLIYKNECLIVQLNDELFVADSFYQEKYIYSEDKYTDIIVRELPLNSTMYESDILYLKLNNDDIKGLIDGLYSEYGKLITTSVASYKRANGTKGIVSADAMFSQQEDAQEILDDLFQNKFKKYFENPNSVLLLEDGLSYEEKTNQNPTKNSRDIKALINDVIDFVATAFHVPAGLLKGDIAGVENMTNNFLIFCVNPIAKLICNEINRKMYGKKAFLDKCYVTVDTKRIKDVDIKALSSAGDLLFRIGVNSINDNLKMLGREELSEPWANEHYVTKNYQSVLSINENLKGGVKDGEKNSKS